MFLPNTPLERMIGSHGIEFPVNQVDAAGNPVSNKLIWTSKTNPDLTFEERIRRRLEVHEKAIEYKWPIWRGPQRLESIKGHVEQYKHGTARVMPVFETVN